MRRGRFLRVRWGICRLALCPSSPHEGLYVAWLEAGRNAVISHDSALVLHDLSDVLPGRVHLTIPRNASRRHAGLTLHTIRLGPGDVTTVSGLRVTTLPRKIADVAISGLTDELVIQVIRQLVEQALATADSLLPCTHRRGGRVRIVVDQALQKQ